MDDPLIEILLDLAPVQKGEAAAPLLRRIERMAQAWVDEQAGLVPLNHRPDRTVL